jgi:cephalosporin hydroxylase
MCDESIKEHQNKTILTKEEFLELNDISAQKMFADKTLQKQALDILVKADEHRWIHQNSWFGEPLLNLPQDMFAIQDIVWRTRPEFIVEVGVAWGGSLLFEASLLEILGGKKVIGIDIFIPNDLKQRLNSHGKVSEKLLLIEGSSTSSETLDKLKEVLAGSRKVLVILDSYHTHDHVLKELQLYSSFVGKDHYIICGDTIVEYIPSQLHRPRPWGPGNNPATAVKKFLSETNRFEVDLKIDQRLLFSCHPGGYLRATKEELS